MADVSSIKNLKSKSDFAHAVVSEKHERAARRSLQDIIIFYQAVEKEMQRMLDEKSKGAGFDEILFERMSAVEEHYKRVMTGFLELDDDSQRNALITFADAVQDLMKNIHTRRAS